MTPKPRPFRARPFLILWPLGVLLVLGLSPLVKWAAYEAGGAASVRALVGQRVALRRPGDLPAGFAPGTRIYRGTLTQAHYRLNDKWGFFDLYVRIEGGGSLSTGLRPSDLAGLTKDGATAR